MKVKLFDFEHEKDLEEAVNNFIISNNIKIIDIKYQISHFYDNHEQLYSYSVLLIYQQN